MTIIATVTGYTYPVVESPGQCAHVLRLDGARAVHCEAPATTYTVDLMPLDRGVLAECCCEAHGGAERALSYLRTSWETSAPPGVGDGAAVQDAGGMGLTSREAYIVVRPEHGIWLAWLGIGGHMLQVANPDGARRDKEGKIATRRGKNGERVPKGGKSFALRDDAIAEAQKAWAANLAETVDRIRKARGGTLAWGLPVEPRTEPILLLLGEHGSAWDAITRGEVPTCQKS